MASHIHRRKPRGRPMSEQDAKDKGHKSAVRVQGWARLRPPEELHGADDPHDRYRPRRDGDHEHGCNMNRLCRLCSRTASA